MNYRMIPGTELEVSAVTLGTWVFSGRGWGGTHERDSLSAVEAVLDHGINCVDTAPIYGNGLAERIVGKAIKRKRNSVVLATKCGLRVSFARVLHDLSPKFIRKEIDQSLKRLQTDYIDLYQCHWPDPDTPIGETMEALVDLQQRGMIRYIGVSNFPRALLEEAKKHAPIISTQNQYSFLERDIEADILPWARENDVGVLAYGPLAGGVLTGKYKETPKFVRSDVRKFFYKHYEGESFVKAQQAVAGLSKSGLPPAQAAIDWVAKQPGVTSVIVGCRNARQVRDNCVKQ